MVFQGTGVLALCFPELNCVKLKERKKYQQAFLEPRFSLKIYPEVLNDEKNLLNNHDLFHLLTKSLDLMNGPQCDWI